MDRRAARMIAMELAAECPNPWEQPTELMRSATPYLRGAIEAILAARIATTLGVAPEELEASDELRGDFAAYERELWQVTYLAFGQGIGYRRKGMAETDVDPRDRIVRIPFRTEAQAVAAEQFWLAHDTRMYDPSRWQNRPTVAIVTGVLVLAAMIGLLWLVPFTEQAAALRDFMTAVTVGAVVLGPALVSLYIAARLPRPRPVADRNLLMSRFIWFAAATWGAGLLFLGALVGALAGASITAERLEDLSDDPGWSMQLVLSEVVTPVGAIAIFVGFIAWTWLLFDLVRQRRSGRFTALLSRSSRDDLSDEIKQWTSLSFFDALDTPPPKNAPMTVKIAWARHLSSLFYPVAAWVMSPFALAVVPWIVGTGVGLAG